MASTEQQALDLFGQVLMERVRDTQIKLWDETFAGTARSSTYKNIHKKLTASFNEEQLDVLGYLMPWIVDNVIAYTLGMLEHKHEQFDVTVHIGEEVVPSLYAISDSLDMALWSEDGWIARFSTKRQTDVAYFQDDADKSSGQ